MQAAASAARNFWNALPKEVKMKRAPPGRKTAKSRWTLMPLTWFGQYQEACLQQRRASATPSS